MARAPHNTETVVREYLEVERANRAPESTQSEFFEFFSSLILLRSRGLSDEQIRDGLVGAGGDGGIDSFYVFVNDILVAEDTDFSAIRTTPRVDVEIIQSKLERSFRETTLNCLVAVSEALFALSVRAEEYEDVYNSDVRGKFELFRNTYRRLLRRAPTLSIRYTYVTIRPPNEISSGIQRRCDALVDTAHERFPDASVSVELIGAAEFWGRIIARPVEVRTLETERASSGRQGYICLATLSSLDRFLRDDDGSVSHGIFEENVRDWQGFTSVNASISGELSSEDEREFWWLNNGVTILCTDFQNDDNILSITNPQIVNGLQTCKELTTYYDELNDDQKERERRSILIKVIRSDNDEVRDQIIRATNSQNSVSVAMLRATDPFQRLIEEYLVPRDLFYERRKNYYANRGRPSRKLVSLTFMTQSALTFLEFRPDDARARPSDPLKRKDEYHALFNSDIPLDAYHKAVRICRNVEIYLRDDRELPAREVNNLRFYVALVSGWILADTPEMGISEICEIDLEEAGESVFERAFGFVMNSFRRLGANDETAKGPRFKEVLLRKAHRQGLGN